ncbi:MAG: hypothetical protein QMB24_07805 [Spirosomataceae bacterium]
MALNNVTLTGFGLLAIVQATLFYNNFTTPWFANLIIDPHRFQKSGTSYTPLKSHSL